MLRVTTIVVQTKCFSIVRYAFSTKAVPALAHVLIFMQHFFEALSPQDDYILLLRSAAVTSSSSPHCCRVRCF